MNIPENTPSLENVPVTRHLIEQLSSHGLISSEARRFVLDLLHPTQNWGLWISRLLLALGVSLILSGIVFFFAFNWTKIPPVIKFSSIQLYTIKNKLTRFLIEASAAMALFRQANNR
jgi:hypothetical protein